MIRGKSSFCIWRLDGYKDTLYDVLLSWQQLSHDIVLFQVLWSSLFSLPFGSALSCEPAALHAYRQLQIWMLHLRLEL